MNEIGVVIVTFNRVEKLKETLFLFEEQTHSPRYMIVVDNASTDSTPEVLEEWKKKNNSYDKYVISSEKNLGGSGGFYLGLNKALELDAEWIWVSDDDAFPQNDALEITECRIKQIEKSKKKVSAICGTVVNNGEIDKWHRRRVNKHWYNLNQLPCPVEDYQKDFFELDVFSYVGSIINKNALKAVGVTEKDFFIWYDDSEHSLRLRKYGKILCVPSIVVNHNVGNDNSELTWKVYYGTRNEIYSIKKLFPRRVFLLFCLKKKYKVFIKLFNKKKRERAIVEWKGIKDGCHLKLGIDSVYKPGWKPKKTYSE